MTSAFADPTDRLRTSADDDALARRFGDVLIERGVVSRTALSSALRRRGQAPPHRRRLGHLLVDLGLASETDVARALAEFLGLAYVDVEREPPADAHIRSLPRALSMTHGLLVMGPVTDGQVTVATHDPQNVVALDDARLHTGAARLTVAVTAESPVRDLLERAWGVAEGARAVVATLANPDPDEDLADLSAVVAEDAPVVRLSARLLAEAVRLSASDIHVEPVIDGVRIRFRVDGALRAIEHVPTHLRSALISRLKLVAGMDIAERRIPQDGRVRLEVGDRTIDARVSSLPGMHGEKIVIRLLTPADAVPDIADLGLAPAALEALTRSLQRSQGLILITGPTGSGKTATLFSALRTLNKPERNIITLEDPVEIQLPGITQVQINERTGLTFARGLRSVLRQDPDVVLVGEIRDLETAELATRASLTGHLVLATLHTNDAASAVARLVDMGIAPFLVASSLSLVVAQRLVRTVCPHCADDTVPDDHVLAALGLHELPAKARPRRGTGCSSCEGTGYSGRRGVFEVLEVSPTLRRALVTNPSDHTVRSAARAAGVASLRADALLVAAEGATTYEEVLRRTVMDDEPDPADT